MKTVLSFIAALVIAPAAFASHGVEKMLPADAHNVVLISAKIAQYPIGSKPLTDVNSAVELQGNPSSETIFGSKLELTFGYDSADSNAVGSGPDGQHYSWDDQRSTAVVVLDVPATTVTAIRTGTVKATDLFSYSIKSKAVTVSKAGFGQCEFNYETGMNVDPNCEEAAATAVVTAPVLSVDLM